MTYSYNGTSYGTGRTGRAQRCGNEPRTLLLGQAEPFLSEHRVQNRADRSRNLHRAVHSVQHHIRRNPGAAVAAKAMRQALR